MIRFFAAHPTAANLLMIALMAAGVFALASLRRETMPDWSKNAIQVTAIYPGASADDIEEAIAHGDLSETVAGLAHESCGGYERTRGLSVARGPTSWPAHLAISG